jgi:hypothetical protein
LANVGHEISATSVTNILKEHGIEPAPRRKRQTTWKTFLKAHWEVVAAVDFTTVEVWTKNGLITFYLLVVMELATRRVHFAGTTVSPEDPWMKQIARNLMAADEGFLVGKRYLLMDRDTKFSEGFPDILQDTGVKPRVRAFSGKDGSLLADFLAFDPSIVPTDFGIITKQPDLMDQ